MNNDAIHDHNNDVNRDGRNVPERNNEVNEVEVVNQDDQDAGDDESANNDNLIDALDGDNENNNGVLDGGVAASVNHIRSVDCPMLLYLECGLTLSDTIPRGTTVTIGLDKTTKLLAVFERFCNFVSSYNCNTRLGIEMNDLEFIHCSVLNPNDTIETAALMKNDRIKVFRNRDKERELEADWMRGNRESDKLYFQQMRTLLPDLNPSPRQSDIIFQCNGKIKDEQGYKQEVLSTFVRGHSAIIVKRCKWLARQIECAKKTSHDNQSQPNPNNMLPVYGRNNDNAIPIPEADDTYPQWQLNNQNGLNIADPRNTANPVEDDDDDNSFNGSTNNNLENISTDCGDNDTNDCIRSSSPIINPNLFFGNTVCSNIQVTLMHPPEAVKLLLEYCYTNRVIPLGYKAFKKSFRPINEHLVVKELREYSRPVEPYTKSSWPNHGMPTVSLSVALAGIELAEEARLPRLSLMCEVAASQLVNSSTVLKALAICEDQKRKTGNDLLYLRKEIMRYHILGKGSRGVVELSSMHSFQRILRDKRDIVVPSLMMGLLETVNDEQNYKIIKNEVLSHARAAKATHYFTELDDDDRRQRDVERMKWRKERWQQQNTSSYTPCTKTQDIFKKEGVYRIVYDDIDIFNEEPEEEILRKRKLRDNIFEFGEPINEEDFNDVVIHKKQIGKRSSYKQSKRRK